MKSTKKWYQKVSNWLFLGACIILIPVLVMNLYIMFQAKTNEDVVPSIFGYKPFIVLSGSMEVEIRKGDMVITKVVDPSSLVIGDVIAFRDERDTVTTHRIIDIVEREGTTYFITKGDNNSSQDQNLVEYQDVEGIYVARIPSVGNLMKNLSEPTTIMMIFSGITVIFAIGFMISTKKQQARDREEFLEYKRLKETGTLKEKTQSKMGLPKKKN